MKTIKKMFVCFICSLAIVLTVGPSVFAENNVVMRQPVDRTINVKRTVVYMSGQNAPSKIYVTETVQNGDVYGGYIKEYRRIVSNTGRTTVYYRGVLVII